MKNSLSPKDTLNSKNSTDSSDSDIKQSEQPSPAPANPMAPMTGKHILAEFWQCQCAPELLTSTQPLLGLLTEAVKLAGLTVVGHAAHEFEQYAADDDKSNQAEVGQINDAQAAQESQNQTSGVTLTLLLAESHLCLHTWGEYQTVTMDVYVCNVANENSAKADTLFQACLQLFNPKQHHVNSVSRQHQMPSRC